jgi:sulfate transport system substrate-binding protein
MRTLIATLVAALTLVACGPQQTTLLNVSYDPTREFYVDFNADFVKYWKEKSGQDVRINMSHGGSGKQARAVIDGLQADVVTLALDVDVDAVAKAGLMPKEWKARLPEGASPYTSTIVFLVRKGNPKAIKDWADLARDDVQTIQPNPKTSGGARWNYLAMWAWADRAFAHDEAKVRAYVGKVYRNSPKLDTGARASTLTFVDNKLGDVLVSWENEAYFVLDNPTFKNEGYEIVYPSMSILAQPPVSLVDKNADAHGLRNLAEAYLQYLYAPAGQKIAAKHYFRPVHPADADPADMKRFPEIERVTVDAAFGGWDKAQAAHFNEGGTFDQIYTGSR